MLDKEPVLISRTAVNCHYGGGYNQHPQPVFMVEFNSPPPRIGQSCGI